MFSIQRIGLAACLALLLNAVLPLERGLGSRRHAGMQSAQIGRHTRARTSHLRTSVMVKNWHRAPLSASTTVLAYPAPPVQARAAYLIDMSSGQVLYSKNPDARLAVASTTKITTAAVVLQHARMSESVKASKNAAAVGESTMSLQAGERLSVRDLLYGLMLNSGNDAAVALAEHVAGSVSRFVAMMNEVARRLNMWNTHYITPHGLDAPSHYSSARDLATISLYAMRDATFRRIVSTADYHIPATKHNGEHWLGNINRVMFWYPGVDGVKPGDTDAAGMCQVVSAWRNGHHLLAVLLHTPTLVFDIRNLLNVGSRNFEWVQAPAFWDAPSNSISSVGRTAAWTYYFGAGHYIRDAFLAYFRTHGGLATFGYPRTEQIVQDGHIVQYFQGGELIFDPVHRSVYPADLGLTLAKLVAPFAVTGGRLRTAGKVSALYTRLGGRGVLGDPVTSELSDRGVRVQFFRYAEIATLSGVPTLVPVGDAALRVQRWLPTIGAANIAPPTMSLALALRYVPPKPPLRPAVREHARLAVLRERAAYH